MHVAIIMDGNGRWANRRGLPRTVGHAEGARTVRRIVEAAVEAGIDTLTLYAFSSDNWGRPQDEVARLMKLFQRYLFTETQYCLDQDVRLNIVGRRDRLDPALLRAIDNSEKLTAGCQRMHLRMAVDYSARHSIQRAALEYARTGGDPDSPDTNAQFLGLINAANHSAPAPDVDLLIRTGGEQRLSDFLLWECAYAELHFTPCLWPEFTREELRKALADFAGRQRRFGQVLGG